MPFPTNSDFDNAAVDLDTISDVVNQNGGTVTTRLGTTVKSLKKAIDDLSTEIEPLVTASLASLSAEIDALEGEVDAFGVTIDALQTAVEGEAAARDAEIQDSLVFDNTHPGEAPTRWTDDLTGPGSAATPLDPALVTIGSQGAVVEVTGAAIIAPRAPIHVEPGHTYAIRYVVQKSVNGGDPSGDTVRLALRTMTSAKVGINVIALEDLHNFKVVNGRTERTFRVSLTAGDGIVTLPAGCGYFRPFVQTYGADGKTQIETIDNYSATGLLVIDAEISALDARIDDIDLEITGLHTEDVALRREALSAGQMGPPITGALADVVTESARAATIFDYAFSTAVGWLYGQHLLEPAFMDAVEISLRPNDSTAVQIELREYVRDAASGGGQTFPNVTSGATALDPVLLDATKYLSGTNAVTVSLPLSGALRPAGSRVAVALRLLDAGGLPIAFGTSAAAKVTSEEAWINGAYKIAGDAIDFWNPAGNRPIARFLGRRAAADLPRAGAIAASLPVRQVALARNARPATDNDIWGGSSFTYWAVGYNPQRPINRPSKVGFWLGFTSTAAALLLDVWARPVQVGDGTTGGAIAPGAHASDRLVYRRRYALSDLGIDTALTTPQLPMMPLDGLGELTPENIFLFTVVALDTHEQPVGATMLQSPQWIGSTVPYWRRGWFRTGTTAIQTLGATPAALSVSWVLTEDLAGPDRMAPQAAGGYGVYAEITGPIQSRQPRAGGGYVVSAAVRVPSAALYRGLDPIPIPEQDVTLGALMRVEVVDTVTLRNGSTAFLSHQYLVTAIVPVVKKVSDNSVLVAGTDYTIDFSRGTIVGRNAGVDGVSVTVSYTGYTQRYDSIVADVATGAVSVIQGPQRAIDPNEYPPTVPANKVEICRVLVTPFVARVLPTCRWRDYVPVGGEQAFASFIAEQQAALAGVRARIAAGLPINIVSYGDSIGIGPGSAGPNCYLANTLDHDWRNFFTARLPSDTLAAWVPAYDGPGGVGEHCRVTWGWHVKAYLESKYGVTVNYYNRHVGGTTSGTGVVPDGRPHGRDATRLGNAVTNDGNTPHLVFIEFGMNDMPNSMYDNMVALCAAFKAVGADVVCLTVPPMNLYGHRATLTQWLRTSEEIIAAARASGAAYLPLHKLFDGENEGSSGFAKEAYALQNSINHPFPAEYDAIGRFATRLFDFGSSLPVGAADPTELEALLATRQPLSAVLTEIASVPGQRLVAGNNLSDLPNKATARANLGSEVGKLGVHGLDIAAAATLNLEAATGEYVDVTGNTGISAITLSDGHRRMVRFTGTPVITVGSSLVMNGGGSNITVAAGDIGIFVGGAGGAVYGRIIKASGKSVVGPAIADITGTTAAGQVLMAFAGRIPFPATQDPSTDPNTLDDYEEVSFTPALGAVGGDPTGVTYSAQTGTAIKVGRFVIVNGRMTLTSKGTGGVGQARITGLPYAVGVIGFSTQMRHSGATLPASTILGAVVNGSSLNLQSLGNTGAADVAWSTLTDTFNLIFSAVYMTAT